MSPLVAAPVRGYPDWQRIDNYDTGVLWPVNVVGSGAIQLSPILDVSRFARSCIQVGVGVNSVTLVAQWYADDAGVTVVGERDIVLAAGMPTFQLALVNMGPFVRLAYEPFGGNATNITSAMFASNREFVSEMVPRQSLLINIQGAALAANSNIAAVVVDNYAGPATLFASTTQQFEVAVETFTEGGTWDFTTSVNIQPIGSYNTVVVLPCGSNRAHIYNTSAAAMTYDLSLVASNTGAS